MAIQFPFSTRGKRQAWCEYLESHARRVYSCIVTPQLRAARELADKIKHRKVGADGFFSCREVYLKGWSGLDTPEAGETGGGSLAGCRVDAGRGQGVWSVWRPTLDPFSGESRGVGMSTRRSNSVNRIRWMGWRPVLRASASSIKIEPTEPSKPGFVGFEGATSARCSKILSQPGVFGGSFLGGPTAYSESARRRKRSGIV